MTDTKPCVVCGQAFARTTQTEYNWRRRTTCSRECAWVTRKANKESRLAETERPCEHCGKAIVRTARMSAGQWAARRFCGHACSGAAQGEARKAKPKRGRCEVCHAALPTSRKSDLPWCSGRCHIEWRRLNPDADEPGRARVPHDEDQLPPVRIRSELLPEGAPPHCWIDRTPGYVAVCCGRCRRRFPRPTVRLAQRLKQLHERVCGRGT